MSKTLSFFLHPVYTGYEPLYLIDVRVSVLSEENYKLYKSGKHLKNNINLYDDKNFNTNTREYSVPYSNERVKLRCFRKDIRNEVNNSVVLIAVTYLDSFEGNAKHRKEDIQAIKRIIDSFQILESAKQKETPIIFTEAMKNAPVSLKDLAEQK